MVIGYQSLNLTVGNTTFPIPNTYSSLVYSFSNGTTIMTRLKMYSGAIFMLVLALICLALHYYFGLLAFQHEAQAHSQVPNVAEYRIEWVRDVFENLQSEFGQLFFQFLLLAGALEFLRVYAFEKDQEEVKKSQKETNARLDRIERSLSHLVNT